MIQIGKQPAPAQVDRDGVIERKTATRGHTWIGILGAFLAVGLVLGLWVFKKYIPTDEPTAVVAPVSPKTSSTDANAPAAIQAKAEILEVTPDLVASNDKSCPPGIVCNSKPIGSEQALKGQTSKGNTTPEDDAVRQQRLQLAAQQHDLVTQRRLGSGLSSKQESTSFATDNGGGGMIRTNYTPSPVAGGTTTLSPTPSAPLFAQANTGSTRGGFGTSSVVSSDAAPAQNPLASQLSPTNTPMATADLMPNRSLMVAKGQSATCIMDTALSSEQLGFVRCVLDFPVMSADGKVVMMERGTTVDGEYKKGTDRGVRAAFVLWVRAVTPEGVRINLDSPATDALGRSGIPGEVESRFWDRFKGALLFSIVQDSLQIATQRATANGGGTSIALFPNTTNSGTSAAGEILKRDADIKDVLRTNQGVIVGITFARDLDFSSVYNLKLKRSH